MTVDLPSAPAPGELDIAPGFFALRDLVGQRVEVHRVIEIDGALAIVVAHSDGPARAYACLTDWADKCAVALQAHFTNDDRPVSIAVVEENGEIGFKNPDPSGT